MSTASALDLTVDDAIVLNDSNRLTISMGWYHSCLLKDAGVWCWGYNGYGQLGNNDRLAGCVIPRIPERARTLGNRHYRLVPSGSTDQLLVSPMVIRRAERAGGVPAVIASRQDCAMLAGGPFLGCAGGPLP
jgi:hypothetical protein